MLGTFETDVVYGFRRTRALIYVAKGDHGSVISSQTAIDLGLPKQTTQIPEQDTKKKRRESENEEEYESKEDEIETMITIEAPQQLQVAQAAYQAVRRPRKNAIIPVFIAPGISTRSEVQYPISYSHSIIAFFLE